MNITVKGYRCFSRSDPLRFSLRDGFVALVGPNNSGKSSLLRMFYELRNVLELLRSPTTIPSLVVSKEIVGTTFAGVLDPSELFCDSEKGDIEILFENLPAPASPTAGYAKSLLLVLLRANPGQLRLQADWHGEPPPQQNMQIHAEAIVLGTHSWNLGGAMSIVRDLHASIYIGPFRNAINTGGASYFDISVGTEFIAQWHNWQVGARKHENFAIARVVSQIQRIMGFERLEINASKELNTLHVRTERGVYKLPELGAGLVQLIICLGRAAMTGPPYIFIDEPELNLHPSLQIDFLTSLASYGSRGIVYATHSMGLARSVADAIFSFQLRDGRSHVQPFDSGAGLAEFLGEMNYSGFQELGCKRLLLVEGVTDVRTLQQWLRLLRAEHQVVCIPLGGSALIRGGSEPELLELKRLGLPVAVLVDSESSVEGNVPEERRAFRDVCLALGFEAHLTSRRATENYLTTPALKRAFGEGCEQLAPFGLLKEYERAWRKTDNWRAAREMARGELMETDIGQFLQRIVGSQ